MNGALKRAIDLQKAGELDEASRIYSEVLERDPACADAWHLLGTVAIARQTPEETQRLIGRALEISPDRAAYHHNIAAAHSHLGEIERSEASYRTSIRLKPDYAEAYFNLSQIVKFEVGDSLIEAVGDLLARPGVSDEDRCFLHFAAGKYCDDVGDYDRTFEHFRRGNAAKNVPFDIAGYERSLEELVETYSGEFMQARLGHGHESELPVFIVGMPRSGTSLVEQILASHPKVFGAGELPDIRAIAGTVPNYSPGNATYPACMPAAPDEVIRGFAEAYLRRVTGFAPTAQRIVDKHPLNFQHLGLIALMFPRARIVYCRRAALDTCLSSYFQNFTKGQEYSFDLDSLGAFYRCHERLMAHWRAVLPAPIVELGYEELVADPGPVSRELLAFCGLEWDDACGQAHRAERPVFTASRWEVRQPIYRTAVQRWRRYERHLGPLTEILGPEATDDAARRGSGGARSV